MVSPLEVESLCGMLGMNLHKWEVLAIFDMSTALQSEFTKEPEPEPMTMDLFDAMWSPE